jgi:hypothetical protein
MMALRAGELLAAEVLEELQRAVAKHPRSFNSSHEGYAVILEELDELWDEVKRQSDDRSYARMRKEAVQVGAMALRFILDVCDRRSPSPCHALRGPEPFQPSCDLPVGHAGSHRWGSP